jgi:hypothetical protein
MCNLFMSEGSWLDGARTSVVFVAQVQAFLLADREKNH